MNGRIQRKALYLQVVDLLIEDIQKGIYIPGSKLPSEDKLALEFSVSRITMREALRTLEEDGLITRRPGVGTFICNQKALPVQTLSTILSISSMFKNAGLEDQFTKIAYQKIRANRIVSEKLKVLPGEDIWEVESLRTINERPAIYSFDFFPGFLVPPNGEEQFESYTNDIYRFLIEVCGQTLKKGECKLKPIVGDDTIATVMEVSMSTPLMYIETVDLNQNRQPILYAKEYYFPDFFEFRVVRSRKGKESSLFER